MLLVNMMAGKGGGGEGGEVPFLHLETLQGRLRVS